MLGFWEYHFAFSTFSVRICSRLGLNNVTHLAERFLLQIAERTKEENVIALKLRSEHSRDEARAETNA